MEMPLRKLPELPRDKELTGELGAHSIWTDSVRPEGDDKPADSSIEDTEVKDIARRLNRSPQDIQDYIEGNDR